MDFLTIIFVWIFCTPVAFVIMMAYMILCRPFDTDLNSLNNCIILSLFWPVAIVAFISMSPKFIWKSLKWLFD